MHSLIHLFQKLFKSRNRSLTRPAAWPLGQSHSQESSQSLWQRFKIRWWPWAPLRCQLSQSFWRGSRWGCHKTRSSSQGPCPPRLQAIAQMSPSQTCLATNCQAGLLFNMAALPHFLVSQQKPEVQKRLAVLCKLCDPQNVMLASHWAYMPSLNSH